MIVSVMMRLLLSAAPWLVHGVLLLGVVASAISYWKRRFWHSASFLLGTLFLLFSTICIQIAYTSLERLEPPVDGSPRVFSPSQSWATAYTMLQTIGLSLLVFALAAFILKTLKEKNQRTTESIAAENTSTKKTPVMIWILRLGASVCFLIGALFANSLLSMNSKGNQTVERKYQDGKYKIVTVMPGLESDAPYSKALYDKAQPGDQLHFGLFFLTLSRNGRQVALEVPGRTYAALIWITLASLTLAAFAPYRRIQHKKVLLLLIGLVEAAMIGVIVFGLSRPL